MTKRLVNDGWAFRKKAGMFADLMGLGSAVWRDIALPHDALIGEPRDPNVVTAAANGYFPGGVFEYRRTFSFGEAERGKRIALLFDGVYRDAMVYVNGQLAGRWSYGYSRFWVRIDPYVRFGEDTEVSVQCRTHQDSRWYSGAGIYRDVHLLVQDQRHLVADSVRFTTIAVDAEYATVELSAVARNDGPVTETLRLRSAIFDGAGAAVEKDDTPVTVLPGEESLVRQRFYIAKPALWDVDTPHLYRAEIGLRLNEDTLDAESVAFGIRTISADPKRGLRINGRTVKLRGACIHHDNGILGAAAIARAEERRVEILKKAGFNAIRSAHNPISSAMLDACDRLGLLVMDETFDSWNGAKMEFDYSVSFGSWWERDVEALVAKNYNHPSVIFYSIGNEIAETGSPFGAVWGRRLAEKVRSLDSTRLITNGVNVLLAIMDSFAGMIGADAGDTNINEMMETIGPMMQQVATSEAGTTRTEESQALLDVAGLNYAEARYALDRDLFPHRIIVGTETAPAQMAEIWALVEQYDHVIGDFTWTGWDYLGEAGIGKIAYRGEIAAGQWGGAYPWLAGGIGDIDLIGQRTPASYYREVTYGLGAGPYIAVHRPLPAEKSRMNNQWSVGDVHATWNWDGLDGTPTRIDVYARAEEAELLLNGKSLGRTKIGVEKPYLATFQTEYAPGEVVAVAYVKGKESGRQTLSSAGKEIRLHASVDRARIDADFKDLAHVEISLTDAAGVPQAGRERAVTVEVSGAGHLQGFGSANPNTEEGFLSDTHQTYNGRALAIVRATGAGEIAVQVRTEGCEPVRLTVTASG